jgi:molecular chaperone GrpE
VTDLHPSDSVEQGGMVSSSDRAVSNTDTEQQEYSNVQQDITSIRETLSGVAQMVSRLQADFENKIKYDESKERTINLLHQELQDYRNDLNFQHLRPLVMELVSLYDNMSVIAAKYDAQGQSQEISAFVQDIEDIVSRHGFEIYQTDSDVFDRTWQNVQKTLTTDNPDLDRHIASRVRKGLRYGERVMRPEMVTVYRYMGEATGAK